MIGGQRKPAAPTPRARAALTHGYRALADYESAKAAWIEDNPGASSKEYEDAMRRIVRECGL